MTDKGDGGDQVRLDYEQLLPSLPAETLAQFEPLSGLMVVNVTVAELADAGSRLQKDPNDGDIQLFSAINHEMYHYFQTIATGYQFQYITAMSKVANQSMDHWYVWRQRLRELKWQAGLGIWGLLFGKEYRARLRGWARVLYEREQIAELEKRARPGDANTFEAVAPGFYENLEKLDQAQCVPGANGLATRDLIEGSAIIYQHALTFGRSGLEERLAGEWQNYDAIYRRAHDFAHDICGPRTLDIILPAIALALRYTNPAAAFAALLTALLSSQPGSEIGAARELASCPLKIAEAGKYLGTAADFRRKRSFRLRHYAIYNSVLDNVSNGTWGVDEIDLLADPAASAKVPAFPFGIVARDGPISGQLDSVDMAARLLLGGMILRTYSLPRYERAAQRRMLEHLRGGMPYIFGTSGENPPAVTDGPKPDAQANDR